MKIKCFFDQYSFTLTYLLYDTESLDAVIIDTVYHYETASSVLSKNYLSKQLKFIKQNNLKLHYILETHAHADHISASQVFKNEFPNAKIAISKKISIVQETFKSIYHLNHLKTDGSQFDLLFDDGDVLTAGKILVKIISTPGHTPACCSFLVDDALFTGDALFMPDYGTGRCDFPQGSAKELYHSIYDKLYSLPDNTRVFVGHDYKPKCRELMWETTIGESKNKNIHINASTTLDDYISFRNSRDLELNPPRLLLASLQLNIDAGRMPLKEENGQAYLKIPISEKENDNS